MRERIQALPEKDRLKDLSDKNLIRFLRCRKFDIERAVKLACDAKRFYTKNADILKDLDGKETVMFDGEHNNVFQVYRNVDKDGKVVIILHPSRFIQAVQSKQGSTIIKKDPSAVLRHLVWQFHNLCQDPHVQVGGLIMLNSFADCSFFESFSFVNVMTVPQRGILIKHLNICGIRMKGVYIFREPTIITALYYVLKAFMSEKLRKRVRFCGSDFGAVRLAVAGDLMGLPREFGGSVDDSEYREENSLKSFGAVDRSGEGFKWIRSKGGVGR